MTPDRLFIDTAFIQALLNPKDTHHVKAKALLPQVRLASEVWLTEAILVEVGNALSAFNRQETAEFIERCYRTQNMRIISIDTKLLLRALHLYQARADKSWGLTDCISFVVMKDNNLTHALTTDRHFVQAGFQRLMKD